MDEKEVIHEENCDWEAECKRYKKLYYDLDQSFQNDKERLLDDFFKAEEKICELRKEITIYRNVVMELSKLLSNVRDKD